MIEIKSKKASSEGSTMLWIVATFIIIFIMILYFVFLGISYLNKGEKRNIETISKNSESPTLIANSLMYFLEENLSSNVKNIDLIKSWRGDFSLGNKIKKNFLDFAKDKQFKCYIFRVIYFENEEGSYWEDSNPIVLAWDYPPAFTIETENKTRDNFYKKGVKMDLVADSGKAIKINYYAGKCF